MIRKNAYKTLKWRPKLDPFVDADALLKRQLAGTQWIFGEDALQNADILASLGDEYAVVNRRQQARAMYEQALVIKVKHLGQDHEDAIDLAEKLTTLIHQTGALITVTTHTPGTSASGVPNGHVLTSSLRWWPNAQKSTAPAGQPRLRRAHRRRPSPSSSSTLGRTPTLKRTRAWRTPSGHTASPGSTAAGTRIASAPSAARCGS